MQHEARFMKYAQNEMTKVIENCVTQGPASARTNWGASLQPRMATGSEMFSNLTSLHTTTFTFLIVLSLVETIILKIWQKPLS